MNRKDYTQKIHQLFDQGNALHNTIHALMAEISEPGETRTAEWNFLYVLMCQVGVIDEQLYTHLYPYPSALADETGPLTNVSMVCTVCRQPVYRASTGSWVHGEDGDNITECAEKRGPYVAIKAMVAAGNENVPASDG